MNLKSLIVTLAIILTPLTTLANNAAAGKAKFMQFCVACHGASGKGDGPAGGALNPKPSNLVISKLNDTQLMTIIKKGGPATGRSPLMSAWGSTLSDQDIKNVIAYIHQLQKNK